ncbi:MAG: flagellar hook-basal body complex protein, partial [Alcaligenaceae bacterium]|nr:flagellar hook-basal body complex protein [Alcaligenaceae bacterium]
MGFGQGLSGLNAAAQELDVIGNNIANANTVGFKASTVAFGDIYATSKVGLGTKVAAVNQRFTVGTITNTGNQLDLAVDGASGMFRMQDALGNIMYTRNGQFFRDDNNFIVNAQGQRLTGFGLTGTDVSPVEVPVGKLEPIASSQLTTRANLNAKAPVVYLSEVTEGVVYARVEPPTNPDDPYERLTYRSEVTDPVAPTVVTTFTKADGSPAAPGNYKISTSSSGSGAVAVTVATPTMASADLDTMLTLSSVTKHQPKPFSPTDPDSYTHSLPITTYDSLGNAHQLTQYFIKREGSTTDSNWDVYYT